MTTMPVTITKIEAVVITVESVVLMKYLSGYFLSFLHILNK